MKPLSAAATRRKYKNSIMIHDRGIWKGVLVLTHYRQLRWLQKNRRMASQTADKPLALGRGFIFNRSVFDKGLSSCSSWSSHVRTGWAHFAALPWLYEALEGRMRVVHLYRNPITTSLSLTTQKLYERIDWVTASALSPHDSGTFQNHLKKDWTQMSQYEKCLFYWTEIHLYGQQLKHENPSWRWHDLRFEDLFGSDIFELRRLVEFSGLSFMPEIMKLQKKRTDNYVHKTNTQNWRLIERYPITCELANGLGYHIADTNIKALADRYFPSWSSAVYRKFRNRLRHTA